MADTPSLQPEPLRQCVRVFRPDHRARDLRGPSEHTHGSLSLQNDRYISIDHPSTH